MNRKARVEFYSRSDIKDLLQAIDVASGAVVDELPVRQLAIYRRGFRDALRAVAAAVGVSLEQASEGEFAVNERYYEDVEDDDVLPPSRLLE